VGAPADDAHLFTWYWPALNGNASAPLLVWLQGGPGASSLFALFTEMGPYRLNAILNPVPNPSTWNTEFSMIFVDNPRGTGYSYSNAGTLCTTWMCYAADFDDMLRQFVGAFQLNSTELYITGESYGGH
jgi:vitellogenic carboxypeptidase-like protein